MDLFGTAVEHNFALLWTIWSGFESSHNKLGTNLVCILTFLDNMTALYQPSGTIFDLFGTRVEHNFAPLWTILSGFQSLHIILGTNLDFFLPLQLVRWLIINYFGLFSSFLGSNAHFFMGDTHFSSSQ